MVNNTKPFYIYAENNSLFIKNINGKIDKIASNIATYSANFDDNDIINICCVDTKGRLIHYIYKNGRMKKRILCKVCYNIKNLKNMRLFIVEKYLNVFLVELSSLNEDTYRVSHYNFSPSNYNISKHNFNNIIKKDESIYKLNIDDMHNMIFTYNSPHKNRSDIYSNSFVFNAKERRWYPSKSLMRSSDKPITVDFYSTIKDDIFEFCYSLEYKKFN